MSESTKSELLGATVAVAAANVFWGFNYVGTKYALGQIDPFALLLLRILFVIPLLIPFLKRRGDSLVGVLRHWRPALVPALGFLASQFLYLYGLTFTTPSHSALMYTLLPIFTVILAVFLINEKITRLQVVGIAIAFIGAFILISEDGLTFDSRYLFGDLMTLMGVLGWAVYTVLSKPLVSRIGSIRTLSLMFIIGLPLSIPLTAIPSLRQPWGDVTPLAWAGAAYLVFFGTFAAYVCYQSSLKHLSAGIVAAFTYSQPMLAALSSVLLLGEILTIYFYISAVLIFFGLIIASHAEQWKRREKRRAAASADKLARVQTPPSAD
jgi:drug/metabolite transporter (DMT)-like permease